MKTIRKDSMTWNLLEFLYHVQFMSYDDLRLLCADSYSGNISHSLKYLEECGYIETSREILPTRVVWITKLGRIYICDKLGDQSYEYTNDSKMTHEYDLARRRSAIESLLDLNRARVMLKYHEVAVHESEKPSMHDWINLLSKENSTFERIDNGEYPTYKKLLSDSEAKKLLLRGVFYTKREVIDWFNAFIPESSDLMRQARFKGVFFNSRRVFLIYVQPYRTDKMFKLNYSDAIAKQNLEDLLNKLLLNIYTSHVSVQALVICNQDGLIHTMATGWKYGMLRPEAKAKILKQYNDQQTRKLRFKEKRIFLAHDTEHEIVQIDDIPLIPSLSAKEKTAHGERDKLMEWFSRKSNSLFSYNNPLFNGKYVVPASSHGLDELQYALFKTDVEIYLEGVKKYRGSDVPVTNDLLQNEDCRNWQVGYKTEPVIYMPVCEVDRLHDLSCDGNQYKGSDTITVICSEPMIKPISHSIRKNVKGLDIDDMTPFDFVPQYNFDGYVTNMKDPYANRRVPAKEKKKRVKNKARGSFVTNDDTIELIKKAATRSGMSLNEFLMKSAKNEAEKVLKDTKSSNQKYPKIK
jgi:hypothetical protein